MHLADLRKTWKVIEALVWSQTNNWLTAFSSAIVVHLTRSRHCERSNLELAGHISRNGIQNKLGLIPLETQGSPQYQFLALWYLRDWILRDHRSHISRKGRQRQVPCAIIGNHFPRCRKPQWSQIYFCHLETSGWLLHHHVDQAGQVRRSVQTEKAQSNCWLGRTHRQQRRNSHPLRIWNQTIPFHQCLSYRR